MEGRKSSLQSVAAFKNVEVKIKLESCEELKDLEEKILALWKPQGRIDSSILLFQRDDYYVVQDVSDGFDVSDNADNNVDCYTLVPKRKLLKLRRFATDETFEHYPYAELIYYSRDLVSDKAKESIFFRTILFECSDNVSQMVKILDATHPKGETTMKTRRAIIMDGGLIRLHLDFVQDCGAFFEIEYCHNDREINSVGEGHAIVNTILEQIGLGDREKYPFISGSYVDLKKHSSGDELS